MTLISASIQPCFTKNFVFVLFFQLTISFYLNIVIMYLPCINWQLGRIINGNIYFISVLLHQSKQIYVSSFSVTKVQMYEYQLFNYAVFMYCTKLILDSSCFKSVVKNAEMYHYLIYLCISVFWLFVHLIVLYSCHIMMSLKQYM